MAVQKPQHKNNKTQNTEHTGHLQSNNKKSTQRTAHAKSGVSCMHHARAKELSCSAAQSSVEARAARFAWNAAGFRFSLFFLHSIYIAGGA